MTLPGAGKSDRAVPLGLGPRGLLPNLYDVVIFILMAGMFVLLESGGVSLGPKPGEVVVVCDQQNNPPESSGVIE
jgi:hypothetical protein